MRSLILLVSLTCLLRRGVQGIKTTCDAPSVKQGEMAKVTCHFERDIAQLKFDFQVIRYSLNSTSIGSVTVLDCLWLGRLQCNIHKGYKFNFFVSDILDLEITKMEDQFAGRYECYVVPTEPGSFGHCFLSIKDDVFETSGILPTRNGLSSKLLLVIIVVLLFLCLLRQCTILGSRLRWLGKLVQCAQKLFGKPSKAGQTV